MKYDLTDNNALNSPYMFQSRIPGVDLHSVCQGQGLTDEQWCTVARQLGRIVLQLLKATSSNLGVIEEPTRFRLVHGFNSIPLDIKSPFRGSNQYENSKVERQAELRPTASLKAFRSILRWFAFQFGNRKGFNLQRDPPSILCQSYPDQLVKAPDQMSKVVLFGNNEYCFCHLDLAARNTIAEVSKKGTLAITGILDWDSAVMAPEFVSYAPLMFLWAHLFDDYEGDTDETRAQKLSILGSDQPIKRAFEETVSREFLHYAYGPQSRLS